MILFPRIRVAKLLKSLHGLLAHTGSPNNYSALPLDSTIATISNIWVNQCDSVSVNLYLWTIKFKFYVIFTSRNFFFSTTI